MIKTTKNKIDKQQGPNVQHRELYSISCNKLQWKRFEKRIHTHTHTHTHTKKPSLVTFIF